MTTPADYVLQASKNRCRLKPNDGGRRLRDLARPRSCHRPDAPLSRANAAATEEGFHSSLFRPLPTRNRSALAPDGARFP